MKECVLAIDVFHLQQDRRGIGFFVREFLNHLLQVDHSLTIHLIADKPLQNNPWPFPVLRPKDLDRSSLVWFPFNHPTFKRPGKYVITLHDLAPFVFREGESGLRKKFRSGVNGASKIFTDSSFIAVQLRNELKVPESKIAIIPPGFKPDWPQENAFHPPKPYLLSIGPAEPRKNFHALMTAFDKLKQRKFPHKLVILGELPPWRRAFGPLVFESDNPFPRLARKMGLADEIIFPGFVSRAELKNWYERASLVVVPSLYEGFGFPVLEAYSCGVPVACSQAASLPEVAGEGAFYFDPRNTENMAATLEHALTNPAGVAKKKEFAASQLSRFTWRQCVESYLEAFRALCRQDMNQPKAK